MEQGEGQVMEQGRKGESGTGKVTYPTVEGGRGLEKGVMVTGPGLPYKFLYAESCFFFLGLWWMSWIGSASCPYPLHRVLSC